MAVYGVNPYTGVANNGAVPFTGWSPTLGVGPANTGTTAGAVWFNGMSQNDYQMMSYYGNQANRRFLAVLKAVTGGAAGTAFTDGYKRVTAVQGGQQGGLIQIETTGAISRNTTAADIAAIQALWNRTVNPATYPVDLSGNGGGSKLSFIGVS